MSNSQVGWIGLGCMGIGIAKNLQKHLKQTGSESLLFTNRTLSRGEPLEALGAVAIPTLAQLVKKCDVIFSCLSNDAVVFAVAEEAIAAGISGKVFVDCSTIHPDSTVKISKMITAAGGQFAASPVFGASPVAEAGRLIFVTAGPKDALARVQPYIQDVMGRSIIQMGDDVSKSSMLKIAGNILVISFMEVISEGHVFAEKTGLGSEVFESMIGDNFGPTLLSYSKRLTTGAYAPASSGRAGFDVALAMKDARHALSCANAVGAKLDTLQSALSKMEQATVLQEGKPLDSSSMYGTIRTEAGLDFYTDLCKKRNLA